MDKLQSVTNYKVMSFRAAVIAIGWKLEDEGETCEVTCDCGNSKITYSGFIGTEVVECENCGKRITDLFSPIRTGNATCSILSLSKFEIEKDNEGNDRYWIAEDGNGGIQNN